MYVKLYVASNISVERFYYNFRHKSMTEILKWYKMPLQNEMFQRYIIDILSKTNCSNLFSGDES